MRDGHSNIGPVLAIGPATLSADNTPVAIDRLGFESLALLLAIGAGGITFTDTNKIEFVLKHGDTDTVNDHVAVSQSDVLGVTVAAGGIVKSLVAAHAAADVTKLSYIGSKRYVSVLADFGGTHSTGTPIAVMVVKGHPASAPVA
ncbi:hypothetical protein CCR97_10230 [Rhodoplanes elegans]|uniref:Uncharacterized protein n=1 Tax=Rhodoplanes elegans TaxID=29408 RepID=A0A327KRD2_9BRAD|nr:hypothetical protein [Rhodoplanes elegans]MBK5958583.1 hypothetical protein [Rhodoplanes elegans]RAI40524.1 hypothetical protein CH338_05930 [Rhodoplanes elegans]